LIGSISLTKLTKEELNPSLVYSPRLHITENDNRSSDFAEIKLFGRGCEGVYWVGSFGLKLAKDLAVGQHIDSEDWLGPKGFSSVKYYLIEFVVVTKKGARTTEFPISRW
jgi:hypothetical protein